MRERFNRWMNPDHAVPKSQSVPQRPAESPPQESQGQQPVEEPPVEESGQDTGDVDWSRPNGACYSYDVIMSRFMLTLMVSL